MDTLETCRACRNKSSIFLMNGTIFEKEIDYFECQTCGYVQTAEPYWLESAYTNAINASDTGIMWRNQNNAKIVLSTLFILGKLNGKVVDWAGGYGILVRLLRDYGIDAFWSDMYCENLLAKGFEHTNNGADLVTAFEAFEHFLDPQAELDKLLAVAPNVLLSTELVPYPAPPQNAWWYYGKEHGQHIGFFRLTTLEQMAKKHGKHLISDGHSYHLITSQPISIKYWKLIRRITNFIPNIFTFGLKSKTWDDHIKMAAIKK